MRQLFTALFVCLFLSSAVAQSIVYVTPAGSGNQSGGSWSDAISGPQLQNRLASASAGTQFWIAGGIYKPTIGTDRTISFFIPSGVQVYGGFSGQEAMLANRQLTSPSSTTLSGEIGDQSQITDNTYHVITMANASVSTRVDGVVITNGNANVSNLYDSNGGGIINTSTQAGVVSNPTIINCLVTWNRARSGAGMYNGATLGGTSNPTVSNCVFSFNGADISGGGYCNSSYDATASPYLSKCIFQNNVCGSSGGGLLNSCGSGTASPIVTDCIFEKNTAFGFGGAINNVGSEGAVSDVATITITRCVFAEQNAFLEGGGIWSISRGGKAKVIASACHFLKNKASHSGKGGAVFLISDANSSFENCLFDSNSAEKGAAIASSTYKGISSTSRFINCTLTRNIVTPDANNSDNGSGAFYNMASSGPCTSALTNCILWENSNKSAPNRSGIINEGGASTTINYSTIQGGFTGTENVDTDPLFVDAANGNFRLKAGSPSINTGDPASTTATVSATDLDGITRLSEARIDMGAYETPATIIRYVTVEGGGDQSGSSWDNAIPGTQFPARLKAASAGTQFWVARGTYRPTATTDRAASFSINAGVSLYGGFIGTEVTLDQRRANQNETILSGDIGVQHDRQDNSQVVVYCENPSLGIRLDGFTIRDSYQDGFNSRGGGGGLQVQVLTGISSIHVSNCRFINHVSTSTFSGGGGIVVFTKSNARCTNVIQNCYFSDNITGYGGAFLPYTDGGGIQRSLVEDCIFDRNAAYLYGGAISNHYSSDLNSLTIQRCQFRDNHSVTGYGMSGAAVETTSGSYAISNCLFANNITTGGNGGALYIAGSKPTFTNCVFTGNSAQNGGVVHSVSERATVLADFTNCHFIANNASGSGGVFSLSSSDEYKGRPTHSNDMRLINCIIRNNTAGSNALFSVDQYMGSNLGSLEITYSNIQGGFSGTGNIDADPQFVDAPNGNFRLKAGSPSINAGDPASTTATVSATDLDSNQRVAENRIDMGAYEFQVSAVTGSDLSLRLSADSRTPSVGQTVTYRLTVTNDGPLTATGVVWQHRLPDNVQYVGGTTLSVENGIVTGNLGTLPAGESVTAMYQLQASQPGQYINAAQITAADQPDPDSQPNSGTGDGQDDAAQVDIRVGGVSGPVYASANPNQVPLPPVQSNQPTADPTKVDLALSLSVDSRTPRVGDLLTYVLTITNQGGTTASNVRATAYLPDGQQFDSSADGMSVSDGGISGGIASIPAGGQASLRFTARLTSAKMGVTKAQIRQASPADVDSTPDNGTDNGEDDTAQVDLRSQTGL